jgi:hypothetical protein
MEPTKRCSTCKGEFPRTEEYFYRHGRMKDGLHNVCKKCHSAYTVAYDAAHRDYKTERRRKWYRNTRREVLSHYSNGLLVCACCGEGHVEFLTLDHMENNGAEHRRQVGSGNNRGVMMWARRNGYPPGLQVLCQNCNSAKAFYGECPHERERREAG